MRTKLQVDEEDVADTDIAGVRKVKGTKGFGAENECLVILKDTDTRDLVCSHAHNLAGQKLLPNEQVSNIRLEIPAHLRETFRTLDQHGHLLKVKYGKQLRRHIRYDNENLSLYLEVRKNADERWRG